MSLDENKCWVCAALTLDPPKSPAHAMVAGYFTGVMVTIAGKDHEEMAVLLCDEHAPIVAEHAESWDRVLGETDEEAVVEEIENAKERN